MAIKAYEGYVETPSSERCGEVIIEEERKLQERMEKQYGKCVKHTLSEVPLCDVRLNQLTAQDLVNLIIGTHTMAFKNK